MNKEETKVTMKIPLFEEGEIEKIDSFTSEIAREINEKVVKEKEMIIAQRLIYNLQTRIDKAIEYIEKEFEEVGCCVDGSDLPYSYIAELLSILKGSDKE